MLTTFPAHQAHNAMLPRKLVPLVSQIPQRVCGGHVYFCSIKWQVGPKEGGEGVLESFFFAIFLLNMTFFQAYFLKREFINNWNDIWNHFHRTFLEEWLSWSLRFCWSLIGGLLGVHLLESLFFASHFTLMFLGKEGNRNHLNSGVVCPDLSCLPLMVTSKTWHHEQFQPQTSIWFVSQKQKTALKVLEWIWAVKQTPWWFSVI